MCDSFRRTFVALFAYTYSALCLKYVPSSCYWLIMAALSPRSTYSALTMISKHHCGKEANILAGLGEKTEVLMVH